MPIANYTTTVPADNSVMEIQRMLKSHNAKSIRVDYNGQEPVGLAFLIPTRQGDLPFQLPANIDAIKKVLERQHVKTVIDRPRAVRVAWRILRDWVRAQMAIIETEMVSLEEVFLPYMLVKDGQSLFHVMERKGYMLTESTNE